MGKSSSSKRRRRAAPPTDCEVETDAVLGEHFNDISEGKTDEQVLRELHRMLGDKHKHAVKDIEDSDGRVKDMRSIGGDPLCETTKAAIARHYAVLRTVMIGNCDNYRDDQAEKQVAAITNGQTGDKLLATLHARANHNLVPDGEPVTVGIVMSMREASKETKTGHLPGIDHTFAADTPKESTGAAIERHLSGLTNEIRGTIKPKVEIPGR